MTQWKINSCWPSVEWQVYDWYLKPMVSWFYLKKAGEPLHVQMNLPDRMVSVINTRLAPQPGLEVTARVYDLDAKLRWQQTARLDAPANAFKEAFAVTNLDEATPVSFVKLELKDARGQLVSDNFYWRAGKNADGLKALQKLPPVRLKTDCRTETRGGDTVVRATISNPTEQLAFFIQLAVTKGVRGEEALPVLWSDNYFSLLPHESREITATIAAKDLAGAKPVLEVGGWNISTDFNCAALTASAKEIKVGEPFTVTASIADTFLDGSRVCLNVDGKPTGFGRAWARGGQREELAFSLTFEQPGKYALAVGNKELKLTIQP